MKEKKTLKEMVETGKKWCVEHKTEISVFGPVLISGAVELIKVAAKRKNLNEERYLKERYVYERTQDIGRYYELRRKIRSFEWRQIDERKSEGETLGSILRDMNLLK